MDDISGKVSALLSDPESLEKIKSIAGLLSADKDDKDDKQPDVREKSPDDSDGGDGGLGIDPALLLKVLPIISSLSASGGDDARVRLLVALRPYLSHERAKRVDEFINVLKLSKVAGALGGTLDL